MQGYYVVRTYEAGGVGEKIKFWIPEGRRPRFGRRLKSDLAKMEQNETSAVRRVARLINANFCKGSLLVGLDYSNAAYNTLLAKAKSIKDECDACQAEEPADGETVPTEEDLIWLAAKGEMKNFIRRVQRALPDTVEFKYVAVTSDMDGETGEMVRVHHHLVINEEVLEAVKACWGQGGVEWSPLSGQADYTAIAEYLMRQVRRLPDAKKYTSSRNLIRPLPKDRVAPSGAELRVPRGGQLLDRSRYMPGRPQYIRYILPPRENPHCSSNTVEKGGGGLG